MKNAIGVLVCAYSMVGFAAAMGFSEQSGLLGAIIAVGVYAANQKGGAA